MKQNLETKTIGKVLGAHGIVGELKILLFSSETDWHQALSVTYIDGQEYQVEKLRKNKTFWILKLSELKDRTLAETLKGKELWAPKSLFETQESDEPYLSELVNFEIVLNEQSVGTVHSFKETQAHFLLVVRTSNGFYEVPYVDHFIEEIIRKKRQIKMNFPEDLLSSEYKLENPE